MNYFLDHEKNPSDIPWLPKREWVVVRSFSEFIEKVMVAFPECVSFGDMMNADTMACCGWLIAYSDRTNNFLQSFVIHTARSSLHSQVNGALTAAQNKRAAAGAKRSAVVPPPEVVEEKIPEPEDERVTIMKQRGKAIAKQREQDERSSAWTRAQNRAIKEKRTSARGITEETTVEIKEGHHRRGRPPKTIDHCWSTVLFLEDAATGSLGNKHGPFYAIDLQGRNIGEVKIGKKITFPAGTFYIAREP